MMMDDDDDTVEKDIKSHVIHPFFLNFRIINYDIALSLHHTMFIPALERLATDEQKSKWLPLALSYQIIGTYAQTELGHGNQCFR